MSAHAKLSASGSKKWLACTPSPRLEEQFPDEGSAFAEEGTFAHMVFENHMRLAAGKITQADFAKNEQVLRRNALWSAELQDHVSNAARVAQERIAAARDLCSDPLVRVETRVDFSPWVPEGFGTGDLVIAADYRLEILDYKHGKGVFVDAEGNSQLRLYALGALNDLGHLYDIKRVRMTVLQPRLSNYGSEELSVEELLDWATNVVAPAAAQAWAGEGEFVAGEHCTSGFCRARFQCAARAEANLALARQDFALTKPELLTEAQIAEVLAKGDQVAKWIGDVQAYALEQAEKHGRQWPGYKLVEGRSTRKYSDADAVAARLVAAGVPEAAIYERSLLGITAMEKAIGKKRFTELLDGLVVKPQGKPTLVPDSDKRAPMNSALEDFS